MSDDASVYIYGEKMSSCDGWRWFVGSLGRCWWWPNQPRVFIKEKGKRSQLATPNWFNFMVPIWKGWSFMSKLGGVKQNFPKLADFCLIEIIFVTLINLFSYLKW